jgi:D-methionine transport system permease protein
MFFSIKKAPQKNSKQTKVAMAYGYANFDNTIMHGTVCVLITLVQVIQSVGDFLYKVLK